MSVNAIRGPARNKWELLAVLALLAVLLVIGLKTVTAYGESWDEPDIHHYADYALGAYRYFFHPHDLPLFQSDLNFYGPAYFMLVALFTRLIQVVRPAWSDITLWHLGYFLTFLVGILLLYLLARRSLSSSASLAACLVFASQPLLWGHAFINPKDVPFMVFFLGSVYSGLEMVDHYLSPRPNYVLIVCAAVVLGLTISIRSAGPLAGAIVGIYAIVKSPRKSVPILLLYVPLTLITAYLTWPFLWGAPVLNFLKSLETMSAFPFPRKALFMGRYYASSELPWFYYPVMLGIQLTLPALLLGLAGLGLASWYFFRHHNAPVEPLLLFLGWFLLPVIGITIRQSALYDNARQLFFLLPPLFLLVGLGLEALMGLLRRRWLWAAAVFLCAFPGLYGSIRLYPYEYVYYNQLVGGTGGAYGHYEMDYWGISYRQAAVWLDQHAQANSRIWTTIPAPLLRPYLRWDLVVSCHNEIDCGGHYDYVVILARWNAERQCSKADAAYTVGRRGAIFTVVRELPPGKSCN